MGFYGNLRIRNKLFSGYCIVILLSTLIGYYGISGMSDLKGMLDDTHDNLLHSVILISAADRHSQQHKRELLRYIATADKNERRAISIRIKREEAQMKEVIEGIDKMPLLEKERLLLNSLRTTWATYIGEVEHVINVASDARNNIIALEKEEIAPLFREIEDLTKQLSSFNVEESDVHHRNARQTYEYLRTVMIALIIILTGSSVAIALFITRSVTVPLGKVLNITKALVKSGEEKAVLAEAIASGDLSRDVTLSEPVVAEPGSIAKDETGVLLSSVSLMSETQGVFERAFAKMTSALRTNREREAERDWFKTGQNELGIMLRGDLKADQLAELTLKYLAEYIGAGVGTFYEFDEKENLLKIIATYAFTRRKNLDETINIGQGLTGQAAKEKKIICLSNVPPDYLPINSSIGEAAPWNIVVTPLLHNYNLIGVIELGSFSPFTDNQIEFLKTASEGLAISLSVNRSRRLVDELLEQTQQQSEELRVQQEELQQSNEELEERAQMLEQQREQLRTKNLEIEESSRELKRKATELEQVSTYKSEFLANMSHELRTPLNSLMILSGLLKDNKDGNLSEKQVEYASTIQSAGRDLLSLINDILDLSKIESGRMEFHYEPVPVSELCEQTETFFRPIAEQKGLSFFFTIDKDVPELLYTDRQRCQQILKNLISNACKFTAQGSVSLHVCRPAAHRNPLGRAAIAFEVQDSGIGIASDKLEIIFNAFQQADGTTSRRFGGTGLGLSISRQLARTMKGDIRVISEPSKGSVFTLYLPVDESMKKTIPSCNEPQQIQGTVMLQPEPSRVNNEQAADFSPSPVPDDRAEISSGSRAILIIEDDLSFAGILKELVKQRGFSVLVAADGESGIALAERYQPSAVILDVMLPHIDGWTVMRSLKDSPRTRHIPVHFITCLEERQKAMNMGAIGYVTKPVSSQQLEEVLSTIETAVERAVKKLLIIEDNPEDAKSMVALLEDRNISIHLAHSGREAIGMISGEPFDCIVLDLGLGDMSSFDILEHIKAMDVRKRIPVIIHTGRELSHEDELKLRHYAESIIIKGAKSPERLLNEVSLFLHLVEVSLPRDKQRMIRSSIEKEAMLEGKKVLIVDDDMRNIFSLSSVLIDKDMIVIEAENGKEALQRLDEHPDVDVVLMDIMMPEMDGYEAIRLIRKDPRFVRLPIIALTAKAMKGDRDACLEAGASDYIPKPVDSEKLFSLLRVWLYGARQTGEQA